MENKIKMIVISSKDRFIRFGYDWFEKFCEKFNTQIIIVNIMKLFRQMKN